MAPGIPVAALAITVGTGLTSGVITYVTLTACGLFAALGAVKVIRALYVPGSSPFGLTETTTLAGAPPAAPLLVLSCSQLPPTGEVMVAPALNCSVPSEAVAAMICGGG